jgi:hypothetical protein
VSPVAVQLHPLVESDASSTATDAVHAWAFKGKDNRWKNQGLHVAGVSFGLHTSLLIERAYQRRHVYDEQPLILKIGPFTYCYCFDEDPMCQLNCEVMQPTTEK